MQKTTQYNLPAAGAAPVIIRTTQVSSRLLLQEDGAAAGGAVQGFIYWPLTPLGSGLNKVGPKITVAPQQEPVLIAGYPGDHPPNQDPIGNGGSSPFPVGPGGPVTLGTAICQATSATATPTVVNAIEN